MHAPMIAFLEEEIPVSGVASPYVEKIENALAFFGQGKKITLLRLQRGSGTGKEFRPAALQGCLRPGACTMKQAFTLPKEEFFAESGLSVGYFVGEGVSKRPFTTDLVGKGQSAEEALKNLFKAIRRPSRQVLKGFGLRRIMPWQALVIKFDNDGGYRAMRPLGFGFCLRYDAKPEHS